MIDWGTLPGGYAWIFPKDDHISIGVGGPTEVSKYLKSYYHDIIEKFDIPVDELISYKAHRIPYRTKPGKYSDGNILMVGDAAGLCEPLTGEGIYYAVRSGQIAAQTTIGYLEDKSVGLNKYDEVINKEIVSELLAVFPVMHIFHAFPERVHNFMKDNNRVWSAFVRILRGEKLFTSFPDSLGSYRFLWKAIDKTAWMIYRRNMRKYKRNHP